MKDNENTQGTAEVDSNALLAERDLKPCPFCEPSEVKQYGNEPILSHLGGFFDEGGRRCNNGFAVICPHCLCQGPKMGEEYDAEEAWNERGNLREPREHTRGTS